MRIVSLCPSITETLVDFGLAEALVGITRFCIHPADVVGTLTKVGGTKDPRIDQIVELAPDLVFVNEEENRKEDFEALVEAGLTVDATMTRTVAEVPEQLRHFGALTDRADVAAERADAVEAGLRSLEEARAGRAQPFRYAYLIWRKPWMAVGADTYVHDLLGRAGGDNVLAADEGRYPEITLEGLRARAPDVVLLPDEPFPFSDKHVPEVQAALPDARVELIGGDDCCWHGVRSIRGLALGAELAGRL